MGKTVIFGKKDDIFRNFFFAHQTQKRENNTLKASKMGLEHYLRQ